MADNSKRTDAIDNVLLAIFAVSFVAPAIGQAYGLETRLIWIPAICYAVWIIFTGYVKPRIAYSDSHERSTVERIRGWSYVISLAITFPLNAIIVFLSLSRYASYLSLADIAVMVSVGLLLTIMNVSLIRMFFWKELKCMNETQELAVFEMVKETGSASIWVSFSILLPNFTLIMSESLTLPTAIIILIGSILILAYSRYKDRKSSKIAKNLSRSLIDSKWSKNYNATVSKRERKHLRRQRS